MPQFTLLNTLKDLKALVSMKKEMEILFLIPRHLKMAKKKKRGNK